MMSSGEPWGRHRRGARGRGEGRGGSGKICQGHAPCGGLDAEAAAIDRHAMVTKILPNAVASGGPLQPEPSTRIFAPFF